MAILYLFAGMKRQADIGQAFGIYFSKLNKLLALHGIRVQFSARLKEVDILRDGQDQDILSEDVRLALRAEIISCVYDLIIVSPPCHTHTRVVFANAMGPSPVRDMYYPDGFP